MDLYKEVASEEVHKHSNDLYKLGNKIWKATRSRNQNQSNVEVITKYLKKHNFHINLDLKGVPNTFEAWYGSGSSPQHNKRVNVAFLCRYDTRHKASQFRGNHLVAQAAVAAALGVKAVLQLSCPTIGKVTVIGCPDTLEGGVATLVNRRAFKSVDVVMMAVPGNRTDWNPRFLGRKTFRATYKRFNADKPPKEVNLGVCDVMDKTIAGVSSADNSKSGKGPQKTPPVTLPPCDQQDVCMLAYQNVMAMQEHFGKRWRLKASYGRTGRTNECVTFVCTAAPTNPELVYMEKRILPCLEAAAHSTECEFETSIAQKTYYSFVSNTQMIYLLQLNAYHCGTLATPLVKNKPIMEPVDVGNVSHVVPTLMPLYYIGSDDDLDSEEFVKSLRSHESHSHTISIAKAIAMTAVDLFINPATITEIKGELSEFLSEEKDNPAFKENPCNLPEPSQPVKTEQFFEGNSRWSGWN